ncbi:hypothetical protein [Nocardia amikacinitolerans]|uniref:hypothetical protein n=1 Tax=Nocardia amikacinitolerans TaxID=756689 RepID=UPI001180C870|nr:hypothetical protein [Nocardia amikacinitolerans]
MNEKLTRREVAIVTGALVLVAAAIASLVWWFNRPNDAERHLNEVRVQGYSKIFQKSETNDAGPFAEAVFIGSRFDPLLDIVDAPGVQLEYVPDDRKGDRWSPVPSGTLTTRTEWLAYGSSPDNCHISIRRIIENPYSSWRLTDGQMSAIRDGSLIGLWVTATCGDG